jgi:nucleoid-associated protein YgaU
VPPAEFSLITGNLNETVNITDLGDITQIGGEALAEIELTSFFPAKPAPYTTRSVPDPYTTIELIEKWRKSKRPIRLIITETPVNLACAIESFTWGERGGNRDVDYSLKLKEYRFIQVKQVGQAQQAAATSSQRPDTKEQPQNYNVKPGDSLFVIAKKIYGDGNKWRELYAKNKIIIGANPNLIKPGQVLQT